MPNLAEISVPATQNVRSGPAAVATGSAAVIHTVGDNAGDQTVNVRVTNRTGSGITLVGHLVVADGSAGNDNQFINQTVAANSSVTVENIPLVAGDTIHALAGGAGLNYLVYGTRERTTGIAG